MDETTFQHRRLSFGPAASAYERARPDYPLAAIEWLLEGVTDPVVDLGAGTGKLTRVVRAAGHDAIAVEPDALMRTTFAEALPGVPALAGSAEAIPLPDCAAGAVVAGQAWHWFDPDHALSEIARVLAPRGGLGVVWNIRDESVAWVAEIGRLLEGEDGTGASVDEDTDDFGPLFTPLERRFFHHQQTLDVEGLVALAATRSHTLTLPETDRERLLRAVEAIGRREATGRCLVLPYVVECLRARRVD